jgi:hypothetical protein
MKETLFQANFDQDINGDETDHWTYLVKAETKEEAIKKLADYIERDTPEWINEFNGKEEAFGFEEKKSAKDVFIHCLERGNIPVMQGRYSGASTSVIIIELPDMHSEDVVMI